MVQLKPIQCGLHILAPKCQKVKPFSNIILGEIGIYIPNSNRQNLPLMREVDSPKAKTEGENTTPQAKIKDFYQLP